jgi:hypothetical protein
LRMWEISILEGKEEKKEGRVDGKMDGWGNE